MNITKINSIFEIFFKDNHEPKTELNYINHYTLLLAIVLSAQTTDVSVNKATFELFKIADTPNKMLKLGEEGLKKHIKSIGLFNNKAQNIMKLTKMLIENYNSIIPDNREELEKFPGVGRKTANVFLNCALGRETIAVDTHVFRVSNRIGLIKSKNTMDTETQLLGKIPKKWLKNAHHWLILHGRYICKAKKPLCKNCKIYDYCEFKDKQKYLA